VVLSRSSRKRYSGRIIRLLYQKDGRNGVERRRDSFRELNILKLVLVVPRVLWRCVGSMEEELLSYSPCFCGLDT
jgi:ribosome biogenesis protein Nip4